MSYKCVICGKSFVDNEGDVCVSCLSKKTNDYKKISKFICPVCNNNTVSNDGDVCEQCLNKLTNSSKNAIKVNNKIEKNKEKIVEKETNVEGIVRNYREFEVNNFLIERILKSMFTFTPFMADKTVQTFQIFSDIGDREENFDGKVCDEIIVYGRILGGSIYDNNYVKVKGRRNRNNTLQATSIYNKTSNSDLKLHHAISPFVLWAVAVLLGFLIYSIFSKNGLSTNIDFRSMLSILVIVAIAVLTVIAMIKTHPFICIGILCVLALIFVFPQYLTASIMPLILGAVLIIIILK